VQLILKTTPAESEVAADTEAKKSRAQARFFSGASSKKETKDA
jgi:hypothetical protein